MMSELLCKVFDADLHDTISSDYATFSLLNFLAPNNILLWETAKIPVDDDAADVWSRREDFHAHVP